MAYNEFLCTHSETPHHECYFRVHDKEYENTIISGWNIIQSLFILEPVRNRYGVLGNDK